MNYNRTPRKPKSRAEKIKGAATAILMKKKIADGMKNHIDKKTTLDNMGKTKKDIVLGPKKSEPKALNLKRKLKSNVKIIIGLNSQKKTNKKRGVPPSLDL